METVFDKIDSHTWNVYGFSPSAILWNVNNWRKYFAVCVLGSMAAWVFLGWDSTWSMMLPFVENRSGLISGSISFDVVWAESQLYYGIGNHFSAPVIYGLLWILSSLYYERIGITKSFNFCVTTALSFMSIGIFEYGWNTCYAIFQNQMWTITFQWKQVGNLVMFGLFIFLGFLVVVYMTTGGYRLRTDNIFKGLLVLSLVCWGLWINYPGPVGNIDVVLVDGSTWTNTELFPQTYYAVDVDPWDNVALGVPHYVGNDMIHLLNTFTKVVVTAMFGYLFAFKDVNIYDKVRDV